MDTVTGLLAQQEPTGPSLNILAITQANTGEDAADGFLPVLRISNVGLDRALEIRSLLLSGLLFTDDPTDTSVHLDPGETLELRMARYRRKPGYFARSPMHINCTVMVEYRDIAGQERSAAVNVRVQFAYRACDHTLRCDGIFLHSLTCAKDWRRCPCV